MKNKLTFRELIELTLISALLVAGKEALSFLPNIHPVTVLLLLAVLLYGWKSLYAVFAFIGIETLLYGVGLWNLMYCIAWPLLIAVAMAFRSSRSWLLWAVLAAVHGLCFGLLCAIPYAFISGLPAAAAYWISGIPFDLIHCVSNFVLTWVLLPVLYRTVSRVKERS